MTRWSTGVALLAVLSLAVGGTSVGAVAAPARGGALTIVIGADPSSLDPHRTPSVGIAHSVMYETLVTVDRRTGEFIPALAESWEVSRDGTAITFKLRRGVKFHDGTAFTAAAVKTTFDRLTSKELNSPGASWVGTLSRTEVVDDVTVRLHFSKPYAPIFSSLRIAFLAILSPTAIARSGADYGQNPVGTGPYRFRQWIPNDRIVYERNPDYAWGSANYKNRGAPYFDQLIIRIIPDEATRVIAFERGDIDILAGAPARDARRMMREGKFPFIQIPTTSGLYLGLNVKRPPVNDVRVRRAIGHAVNTDEVARIALEGLAVPMMSPIAPTIWGYWDGVKQFALTHDPERARTLLAEAGYRPGAGGAMMKDGRQLEFTVWTYARMTNVRIGIVLQSQLRAVGIKMNIEQLEPATLLAQTARGEHDALLIGYGWPDADILYYFFHSSRLATTNRVHYTNAQVDKLLEDGQTIVDPARRLEVYKQLQRILLQEVPWVPLASELAVNFHQPYMQDVYYDKFGNLLLLDAQKVR
ncbi:MAG TPA: ABC transporter substrate-binding protein [bacterium]|nr:ABC transporter substrate-binding protein [bacterium]